MEYLQSQHCARYFGICKWTIKLEFSSVIQLCLTLCYPMNPSMPGLPVHHKPPQFTQTHAHRVGDAVQSSHPLLSPSPPAHNPSQHQSLFQWVIPPNIRVFSNESSLPTSGSFPMSQLFTWGGQSSGVSVSASVLPMNTQDWSPLGWTGWISL